LAGFSESSWHIFSCVILPPSTPYVYNRVPLVSTPGIPPGILVKSSLPRAFCSVVKLQWSVETVWMVPSARAFHKHCESSFFLRGGAHTYLAASMPGREYRLSSIRRYCGQVSA